MRTKESQGLSAVVYKACLHVQEIYTVSKESKLSRFNINFCEISGFTDARRSQPMSLIVHCLSANGETKGISSLPV